MMKYWEGRGKKTSLVERVEEFFDVRNVDDVVGLFYKRLLSKEKIASFSRRFMEAVEEGDDVAREILYENLEELVEGIIILSRKLRTSYISYTDGMFNSCLYKRVFQELLGRYNLSLKEKTLSCGRSASHGFEPCGESE